MGPEIWYNVPEHGASEFVLKRDNIKNSFTKLCESVESVNWFKLAKDKGQCGLL